MTDKPPPGCLLAILRLFGFGSRGSETAEPLPYRLAAFLTPAELSFFRVLQLAVDGRAAINCKVNLGDLFDVDGQENFRAHRNRIDRKHVDFLLCDPQTMRPLFGIELDDSSHQRSDRMKGDDVKNRVFAAAGLPLLRVAAQAAYSRQQLAVDLMPYLAPAPPLAPGAAAVQPSVPICPKCDVPMIQRVAAKGPNAGRSFWGCPNYPRCRATA